MIIGVPTEIKTHEYRVGLTPASVRELVHAGHRVIVQSGAGDGIGDSDDAYMAAGAEIIPDAPGVFSAADMVVKVKEPQPEECSMLREGQVIFTYLHLAPDPGQTRALMTSGVTAIAYETVTDDSGGLPLLAPMSEVAGRMSVHAGATSLEKERGGRGVLLAGVPGVLPGRVVILGGGVAGTNAARIAHGIGADVTIIEKSPKRMRQLDDIFSGSVKTVYSTVDAIESLLPDADLVIGAVLVPGAMAPRLVSREMLKKMNNGAVIVDIAIDQGGCVETSRPTTHADPTFVEEGVVHYCVANMPGAVARTSALALNNATLPFVMDIAGKGWKDAMRGNPHLLAGLNVHAGGITCEAVARGQGADFTPPREIVGAG